MKWSGLYWGGTVAVYTLLVPPPTNIFIFVINDCLNINPTADFEILIFGVWCNNYLEASHDCRMLFFSFETSSSIIHLLFFEAYFFVTRLPFEYFFVLLKEEQEAEAQKSHWIRYEPIQVLVKLMFGRQHGAVYDIRTRSCV